ncbi:MAG: Glutaryl-CoA dehydrogenase [Planctomycetota bacterium]|jgi:alkylation response protein AidB-like acyl-CoA dehydrogenase
MPENYDSTIFNDYKGCRQWLEEIAGASQMVDATRKWPAKSLEQLANNGVLAGLFSNERGGTGWSSESQLSAYFHIAKACLTTAFILTQWHASTKRLEVHASKAFWDKWQNLLVSGTAWTTVGISHLTTSRQHVTNPPLTATRTSSGYQLNGYAPWVTGAAHAQLLVVGAVTEEQQQILVAVETAQPEVISGQGFPLIALSASCTDRVDFHSAFVPQHYVLAGPNEQVLKLGSTGPGGLHTSILALGLASRAIDYLLEQSTLRPDFLKPSEELQAELTLRLNELLSIGCGRPSVSLDQLRQHSNSLVLRATQAALAAAKGAGYCSDHPVGRWCREALFFLVWSCPQSVVRAQVCELAGLSE